MKKIDTIKKLVNKKFRKSLAVGALAASLAITPIGTYINPDLNSTVEAKKKSKKAKKAAKKIKLKFKRAKGNKKTKNLKSGKSYKEKYSIKLLNGKKKMGKKKFTIILREKDKVLKVTPKKGIKYYSKKLGAKKSIIKKGKKAKGFKLKYFVDPNVKLKLRQNITVICTYILKGKKHVTKKKIKNIRFVLGKDYKKKIANTNTDNNSNIIAPLPQEQVDKKFEEETGEKLNIVETPAPMPTIKPDVEIDKNDIKEPENPNEDVTYYDDNGKTITDPNYTPEPLPTANSNNNNSNNNNTDSSNNNNNNNTSTPEPTIVNDDKYYLDNGNVITIKHDMNSYNEAENDLFDQKYDSGIVLNSIDPLVSTLYFSKDSGLSESNAYLDYLKLSATDKNNNDISNNITVYDYNLKQNNNEESDNKIIVKVSDNNGKSYLQFYDILIRNDEFLNNMPTGEVTISENDQEIEFYEVYQLSLDPVVYAQTDRMRMKKTSKEENVNTLMYK